MKSVWINDIRDEALRQTHISGLVHDVYIKQLRGILEDREKELVTKLIASPDNMGNNWAMFQAHLNGRLYDLREVLSLLNFDQKE